MQTHNHKPQVFISHSSIDTWVAKQIASHIEGCGASSFLDEADVQHGDDFENEILKAAHASQELLVLLTPWATTRPYIWLEMGVFWGNRKRIVGILHGLSAKDLSTDERIPVLLKRTNLLALNEIDLYFAELEKRISTRSTEDD